MSAHLPSSSSLDPLIEWLYDAAVDARAWKGMAPLLAASFGADSAVFKLHGDTGVQLLETTENLVVAPRDAAWADHWHSNDVWVERALALNTSGIVTSAQLMPEREFERSGYYQDWNRHLGVYHMMGTVFPVGPRASGVVGLHRPRRGGAFSPGERRRLSRLLPHLQRAMRIRDQLAPVRSQMHTQLQAFDQLRTPALVLDAEGRLQHTNAQGEALLREASALCLREGRVAASDVALGVRWRRLLQEALAGQGGAMRFERPGQPPLTALITPLRTALQTAPAVLVLLRDPGLQLPSTDLLRELFGLTLAEARVAAGIAEGLAPEQVAQRLNVGIGTVRSHLRQALAKTGTHRQNELAALITRSVAMLG